MFRREMCTGKIGIEARRNGLAARGEEQRSKLLQNRRNVEAGSTEKKVLVPKPKESATERRARLNQYREMKIRRESELRTERMKTPAFKIGAAPAKERSTPSTARKMLNFDFKKTSDTYGSSASKTPAARKAFQFTNPSAGTTTKKAVADAHSVRNVLRTAVKRNLQTSMASDKRAPQSLQTPRTAPKTTSTTQNKQTPSTSTKAGQVTPKTVTKAPTPSRTTSNRFTPSKIGPSSASKTASKTTSSIQKKQTPSTSTNRGHVTPKIGTRVPTPSRTISNRFTPSKIGLSSASKKPPTASSSSSGSVDAPKSSQTPRKPLGSRPASTKKTTPSGTGTKPTPNKSSTTPLKSVGLRSNPPKEKTTPKQTPLASRTRLNLLKQKTEKSDATTEEIKSSVTPSKHPTTSLRRAQSSNNLSRPTPSSSAKKPDLAPRVRNPQPATTLKRAQSTNNLSRPSPLKGSAKPGPLGPQNKTPQMKLQRSTSASTLTRKALTLSSPGTKPRLNLSKKIVGDCKNADVVPNREAPQKPKLNTRSHSTLTSVSKPGAMSRIQAAILKRQANAEAQKQDPVCDDEENNKKWADLMALIQAQKDL